MKAIIIDDEEGARNVLKNLLARTCPEVEIIQLCENVPEGVKAINKYEPDLVFLDVEMPDYAGYELIQFFEEVNFKIIFATAYDQYAIKAFELSAVDYLLKPINRQKLIDAVEKTKIQLGIKKTIENYNILLESIKENKFKKIIIPELNNRRILNLDDIIAIEAQRAYSCIYLENNKQITVSKHLGYFESALPDNNIFFRSHKSWIINLNKLVSYNKSENTIILNNDIKAKISKLRFAEFEKLNFG